MNELLAMFAAWLDEIDREPFAHQAEWDQWSGDCLKGSAP